MADRGISLNYPHGTLVLPAPLTGSTFILGDPAHPVPCHPVVRFCLAGRAPFIRVDRLDIGLRSGLDVPVGRCQADY